MTVLTLCVVCTTVVFHPVPKLLKSVSSHHSLTIVMRAGLSVGTHQQSPTDFSILIEFPFPDKHRKNNKHLVSKLERHLKNVYNITLVILYVLWGRKPQLCRRGMTLPGQN